MKTIAFAAAVSACVLAASGADAVPSAMERKVAPNASEAGNSTGVIRFGAYYEDHATTSCDNFINCFLTFAPGPAKKAVLLDRISCLLQSTNSPSFLAVNLPPKGGSGFIRQNFLPVNDYRYNKGTFSETYYYFVSLNEPIKMYLEPATSLQLNFYTNGSNSYTITMNCSITGQVAD